MGADPRCGTHRGRREGSSQLHLDVVSSHRDLVFCRLDGRRSAVTCGAHTFGSLAGHVQFVASTRQIQFIDRGAHVLPLGAEQRQANFVTLHWVFDGAQRVNHLVGHIHCGFAAFAELSCGVFDVQPQSLEGGRRRLATIQHADREFFDGVGSQVCVSSTAAHCLRDQTHCLFAVDTQFAELGTVFVHGVEQIV